MDVTINSYSDFKDIKLTATLIVYIPEESDSLISLKSNGAFKRLKELVQLKNDHIFLLKLSMLAGRAYRVLFCCLVVPRVPHMETLEQKVGGR